MHVYLVVTPPDSEGSVDIALVHRMDSEALMV